MTATLKQRTAKSNTTVKRIGKNAKTTTKIKRSEDFDGGDRYLGWTAKEEQSYIRDSGIYESYSSMKGMDSWD